MISLGSDFPRIMQPAISQVCTLNASFDDDIAGYADAGGTAIELWLTKLEDHLRTHSVAEVRSRAGDRGLRFAAASYQGGILISQGDARGAAWDQFQKRLELCADLGVPTLVVTADFLGPFGNTDIERAKVSLRQAGAAAAPRGVRLALEFQARNTFLNNLETAAMFVQSVQHPSVGICFDVFHYSVGPSKFEDLDHLTADNLFHVQVCDLADRPRELAADADRILPGDGDLPLARIFARFREIGYAGFVSLEVLNPILWRTPSRHVGEIGLTALRVALGLNREALAPTTQSTR